MSRLSLDVKVNLEGISDGWTTDHYMKFHVLSSKQAIKYNKTAKAIDKDDEASYLNVMIESLKGQFIEGSVLVGEATAPAEVEDIPDLPAEVIAEAFTRISRSKFADPKAI